MHNQPMPFLFALGVLLLLSVPAHAYPVFFRDRRGAQCTEHPTQGFGPHGTPVESSANTLSLFDQEGNVVTQFCHGENYTLRAEFKEESRSYLSTSFGTFAEAERNDDSDCPNRVLDSGSDTPVGSKNLTLSIPCDKSNEELMMLEENITIRMTAASGAAAPYLQSTSTIPRNASCTTCSASPPAEGPAPSPPPSSGNKTTNAADAPRASLAVVAVVLSMVLLAGL